uniref:Uncharacterized protein n=1 Tax=Setaria viridis TaxID=4556 RepID=A0A4U6WGY0_SETVI|nr:hypothetical protein SEVIR_1G250750v2 [Setaria viridis]
MPLQPLQMLEILEEVGINDLTRWGCGTITATSPPPPKRSRSSHGQTKLAVLEAPPTPNGKKRKSPPTSGLGTSTTSRQHA